MRLISNEARGTLCDRARRRRRIGKERSMMPLPDAAGPTSEDPAGGRAAAGRTVAVLLTNGFRPFFLAAGIWSAAALGLWIAVLVSGARLPSRFDPLAWHMHEMIFGFALGAVAGFLLTAMPN